MKIDDVKKIAEFGFPRNAEEQAKVHQYLRSIGIDPSNLYQELEMSSRFVNTHRDSTYSNVSISLHSHDYYELIFCRSGGVEYLIGSERYRLRSGDIVFVPPGISHRPIMPEHMTEAYLRDVIWMSQEFIDQLIRIFPDSKVAKTERFEPIRTAGTRWEFLGDLFRNGVNEEEQKRPGWDAAVAGNTLMIISNLIRIHREKTGTMKAENPELLDRVTAYIESNYPQHITIADLARQFYVSESSVSHLFRQRMGVSVYRYITQRRLIAAKTLIRQKLPLETVAHQVGFVDYSTFYRAFKQEYGISPRKFGQM